MSTYRQLAALVLIVITLAPAAYPQDATELIKQGNALAKEGKLD